MLVSAHLQGDGYKFSHHKQYSPHTEVVYSTWTPRKSRMKDIDKVVFFGLQYFIKDYLIDSFNTTFFNKPKDEVINEFKSVMKQYNGDEDASHWEALYDLGYLPLKICAIPEGTLTPIRVPMFTIENTKPEFYWLTNFIETILSTEIWKPMTSATIALQYRKILEKWSEKTCDNNDWIDYAGHDFSLRGMVGLNGGCSSGAGHLLCFKGTDTLPAILWLEQYYNARNINGSVGCSIPATEHSVAETNIIEIQELLENNQIKIDSIRIACCNNEITEDWIKSDTRRAAELLYMSRLLDVYPSGFFSYVADTYNLWSALTDILPLLKDRIMNRNGRVVIRPDSGDPVDILCGLNTNEDYKVENGKLYKQTDEIVSDGPVSYYKHEEVKGDYIEQQTKGVIELLWDVFGGTVNSKGYKVLDPHIGCIYGDAITLERAEQICKRLENKGFASSNVVLGIGSYTYNMNTRDTFGFALKTTYGVVNGKELLLYKDPITDDGTKKSARGMVAVVDKDGELELIDNLYKKDKESAYASDLLQPVFENGKLLKDYTLEEIRETLRSQLC